MSFMASVRPISSHALDNLRYIRETMERAGSFTAVPGYAGALMGFTAILAAAIAFRQPSRELWLATWLAEGMLAVAIGAIGILEKCARIGTPLRSVPARKIALSFAPPLFAGALLTSAVWRTGNYALLPGLWLLLYGAAIITAGAYSVRAVPVLGTVIAFIGGASLFVPQAWGDAMLAAGFGVTQIGFGLYIARRHGG